jgi:hypothetical protein
MLKKIIILLTITTCYFQNSYGSTDINIYNHDDLMNTGVGNKISQITISKCNDENECKRIEQTFNHQGLKTSEIEYDSDGSLNSKKIYKYNDSMQLLSYEKYNDENKLDDKEVYTYDSINRIIEIQDLNGRGKIDRIIALFYSDTTGKLIKSVQFDKHKRIEFTKMYIDYDEHNNYTKIEVYDNLDVLIETIDEKYEYYK